MVIARLPSELSGFGAPRQQLPSTSCAVAAITSVPGMLRQQLPGTGHTAAAITTVLAILRQQLPGTGHTVQLPQYRPYCGMRCHVRASSKFDAPRQQLPGTGHTAAAITQYWPYCGMRCHVRASLLPLNNTRDD
uniref:Secreted protein n=1 Tax=Strongyloides papillosus TaxID=174720 RepID=A0A0N5BMP7_STREA